MSTLVVAVRSQTSAHPALGTGIALAVTVALFYAMGSIVWLSAPGPLLGYINSPFHGLDFQPTLTSAQFAWGGFVERLAGLSRWAFRAGTFHGVPRQASGPGPRALHSSSGS